MKSASLDNPMSVMNTVFIERIGDDNVYRSRDCQQLVQDKARCSACEDLVISDGINQDVLERVKEEKDICEIYDQKLREQMNGMKHSAPGHETNDNDFVENIGDYANGNLDDVTENKDDSEVKATVIDIKKKILVKLKEKVPRTRTWPKNSKLKTKEEKEKELPEELTQCPFCERNSFKNNEGRTALNDFIYHIREDHIAEKDNPIFIDILQRYDVKVVCSLCGASFDGERQLKRHENKTHRNPLENPLTCELCGKKYAQRHSLYIHMKHMHDTKKCLCGVCGKEFDNERSMKYHHRVNHGELYKCNECGKEFKARKRLTDHIKMVHLRTLEFKCQACEKQFQSQASLKQHTVAIHEKIQPFFCEQLNCPFRCNRYDNLNVHRLKMHQLPRMGRSEFRNLIQNGEHPNCKEMDMELLSFL